MGVDMDMNDLADVFGSTDNTNLPPGGAAFSNVGSGPEAIEENYIRCWYNAAIKSGWQRFADGADGPVTMVAVGRSTSSSINTQPLLGDSKLYISPKEMDPANSSLPTVSSYRDASTPDPLLTVPTTLGWRAYALTEPAAGVSGTSYIMDLTADAVATTIQNGQSSAAGNYTTFGTVQGASTGSRRMEIAFAAVVAGVQMSKADILADIMPAARATLALRGITGV